MTKSSSVNESDLFRSETPAAAPTKRGASLPTSLAFLAAFVAASANAQAPGPGVPQHMPAAPAAPASDAGATPPPAAPKAPDAATPPPAAPTPPAAGKSAPPPAAGTPPRSGSWHFRYDDKGTTVELGASDCPTKDCCKDPCPKKEEPKPKPHPRPKPKPLVVIIIPPDILPLADQSFCQPRVNARCVTGPQYDKPSAEEPGYSFQTGDPLMPGYVANIDRLSNSSNIKVKLAPKGKKPEDNGYCAYETGAMEPVIDEFAPDAPATCAFERTDPPTQFTAHRAPAELCGTAVYSVDGTGKMEKFEFVGVPDGAPDNLKCRVYTTGQPVAVVCNGTKGWGMEQGDAVYGGTPNTPVWPADTEKRVCMPRQPRR